MPARGQNNGAANELKKITAEYKKLLGEIKKMTVAIAKMGPGGAKVDMKEQVRQAEILRRQYEEIMSLQRDSTTAINASVAAQGDMVKKLADIAKGHSDVLKLEFSHEGHAAKLEKEMQAINKYTTAHWKDLSTEHKKDLLNKVAALNVEMDTAKLLEDQNKLMQARLDGAIDNLGIAKDFGLEIASSIENAVNKLPGGKYLSKLFGADKLKDQFTQAFNQGVMAYIKPGGDAIKGAIAFSDALKVSKGLIAVGIVVALAAAVAFLGKLEASAKELAKQTGISRDQAFELEQSIRDRSYSEANSLASNKEIAAVLTEQVKEFGRLGTMSADTASKTVQIGEAFGYGAETAGQVAAQLMTVGGLTATAALDAQTFGAAMAEAEGVAPGKVMKDIATNSKVMAKFMAGNAKLMMKTAIEAAKLGMSVADMAKVADGLLDIEGSLTKQYEAQALLGRELNFDKARQLALEGNIAGATEEVLAQAGDYNDLANMSYLARKKVAEASGLEVDQLMRAAKLQEVTANMSEEQRKHVEATGLSMAQLNNMSSEQILSQAAANAQVEKMEGMWQEISNTLINSVLPPVMQIVSLVATVLMPVLKIIGGLLYGILLPIMLIGEGIAAIVEWVQSFEALSAAISVTWNVIVGILKVVAVIIGVIVGLAVLAAIAATVFAGMTTLGVGVIIAMAAIAGAVGTINAMTGKQMGGAVTANTPYTVGESGREVFTPAQNGHITSNAEVKRNDKGGNMSSLESRLDKLIALQEQSNSTPSIAVLAQDVPMKMNKEIHNQESFNV